MAHILAVAGGKGGIGKTTTSINLGAALNYFGKDVTIVDANLSTPNIGIHLGSPKVPIHLHHVVKGLNHISEAVYLHKSGMKVIPASLSIEDFKDSAPEKLKDHIQNLKTDIALLDTAAGLGREALASINAANKVLIVTNPELPSLTDALKTIKLCHELNKNIIGVVLAKTNYKDENEIGVKAVEQFLGYPVISIIPEDKKIKESLRQREPVVYLFPKSEAAIAYKKLAAKLIGREYDEVVEEEVKEEKGFFSKLFSFLK